jgi:hypothetical protein
VKLISFFLHEVKSFSTSFGGGVSHHRKTKRKQLKVQKQLKNKLNISDSDVTQHV